MRSANQPNGYPASEAPGGELDLSAIRSALWRRRRLIIVPTVLVGVLAFVGVNLVTPKYRSEARILIETRENVFLRPEAEKQQPERSTVDEEAVQSQVQVVLSREVAREVIKELRLNERPEFDPAVHGVSPLSYVLSLIGLAKDPLGSTPEERVLNAYYERLSAYPVEKSRVIGIEFKSRDPVLAAEVANAIANAYLVAQQKARQTQNKQAGTWLAGEIDKLRQKVEEAEKKVADFRAQHSLFVGTNNTMLNNQQLGDLNAQLAAARAQKADAESKAKIIRDMLKQGRSLESSEVMNSELMRRLSEQLITLRAQLAEQSSTLLGLHPRIRELRAQIADLQEAMRQEAIRIARSLENDARTADARVKEITASLNDIKQQAALTDGQDVQLRALDREAKAQRDLLESYLAKYREATARESLNAVPSDARVISRAVVSNTPYFPKKLPIILIATLGTLVLSAGFVVTSELLSGNVYRPVVAAPLVPEAAPVAVEPVVPAEPAVPPSPARTSLTGRLFGRVKSTPRAEPTVATPPSPEVRPEAATAQPAQPAEPAPPVAPARPELVSTTEIADLVDILRRTSGAGRRITVVGGGRGVGTTKTAIALGRALVRDSKTILIDLAPGSPNVGVISADPRAPGIAELVRGTASFGQIITRDRFSRLHLVTSGQAGVDVGAMLLSQRLAMTIDALGRTYDHVVIDAGSIEDTALESLARLAPQGVLVATAMPIEAAQGARERMMSAGFEGIAVFTGRPPRPDIDAGARSAALVPA